MINDLEIDFISINIRRILHVLSRKLGMNYKCVLFVDKCELFPAFYSL